MDSNNLDYSKFLMREALFFYRYSFIQQQRILNYVIAEIKLNLEKETSSKSDLKQNRISLKFKRRAFHFTQTVFSPFLH